MNNFIPVSKPAIGEEEINEVIACLQSGWLTTGARTHNFENEFKKFIDVEYSLAVNSCTAGLHLALECLGIGKDDEVITTDFTFVATVNAIENLGAIPVLVDIEKDTLCIDPNEIEKKITSKTKAIIAVHYAGHPCDMDKIKRIAKKHNLYVIEDAAHALPTRYKGQLVGNIGDITVFSFYPTKTMTTGEGGMICTQNKQWIEKMKMMSLHGLSLTAWDRYEKGGSWFYEVEKPGMKYNMSDLSASIGIHQIKKIDSFVEKRKKIAQHYNKAFKGIAGIQLPIEKEYAESSWFIYPIRIEYQQFGISRQVLINRLAEVNIGTSVHFIPIHLHKYYKQKYQLDDKSYKNSTKAYENILSIPLYTEMTYEEVEYVINAIKNTLNIK